ncbi:LOW QUALITY PROTEIN: hypothetical protein SPRG_05637 [Saprolegnia parasitica CBS 223.65]|uniref:Uncharacterized protein n=1 Tax=Saprolegnia parasitica (strain CBS 223.65) TaxID=695850 RepID=A0A067CT55_SAPPC|nr:LOW QUALITY PROTEIN: hypothetical protein SPRG_05637 [Saprolegnia parasitica CBS 223.65]KDO29686.1 LOW QUALITY PROTEIN: hypothetical protein SPRG_05637 [Saprolegnia parasitica CBS 223.65]|eukprot:XP_012199743.1 LOW QUALITY PROTEIN: hypothetical protein SPRG_05637 [Saprolegnia parasitica CBS 223.65]
MASPTTDGYGGQSLQLPSRQMRAIDDDRYQRRLDFGKTALVTATIATYAIQI